MITREQIIHARDAAIECVYGAARASVNLGVVHVTHPGDEVFQLPVFEQIARIARETESLQERAEEALPDEVETAIGVAIRRGGWTAMACGAKIQASTYHRLAVDLLDDVHCVCLSACAIDADDHELVERITRSIQAGRSVEVELAAEIAAHVRREAEQAIAGVADPAPPEDPAPATSNGGGGRPRKSDPEADAKLVKAWKEAKAASAVKAQFAEQRGVTMDELDRAIDRHRHRKRSEKPSRKNPSQGD